jgi:DNA-binding SARP family transcriptional activator
MQKSIMITERHKEYSHASQVRFDSDISMRQIFPTSRIKLLGTFLIASDYMPLTNVEVPRLQSLLAYLILHRGVPQSRTRLASLLWPEASYRHLMRLYTVSGNRAAAMRIYQNCVAVLKRELAVEPSPVSVE